MSKRKIVPNVALVLTSLGALVFLFSLVPINWDRRRGADLKTAGPERAQVDNAEPQGKERKIVWGDAVQGLRLGIICDFDQPLPGQDFGLGLCVENVGVESIKVEKFCSVSVRAQRRNGDSLEDMAPTVARDDPLFNFAILFQDELKPGAPAAISCGFSYQITKGFLRVGNSRYGPFLAGQFTFVGEATINLRGEAGAKGERILLNSRPATLTIRDVDWGPAHDGVQIALAEYPHGESGQDIPVFALLCRNSSKEHRHIVTGFDPFYIATANAPDGKPAKLIHHAILCGEGGFDLEPGEIECHPHQFRWKEIEKPVPGEYTFLVKFSSHTNKPEDRVLLTTYRLKLWLPK
jgi:hypothetical protein